MSTVIYCHNCNKCLAMINKGKVRTDERMYCEECYQKSKNPFKSSAGDSMNERDGGETVDYLKKMFGMED